MNVDATRFKRRVAHALRHYFAWLFVWRARGRARAARAYAMHILYQRNKTKLSVSLHMPMDVKRTLRKITLLPKEPKEPPQD